MDCFKDPGVGVAYGRQLPHKDANPIAIHHRLFNYPDKSYVRSFDDRHKYGIKACSNSNSFSAYRASALKEVGGFFSKNIVGEDVVVAKILEVGWKVKYCSNAQVHHSHNYTMFFYLLKNIKYYWNIKSILVNVTKFLGYKMGYSYNKLSNFLRLKLSMHKSFWGSPKSLNTIRRFVSEFNKIELL